MSLKLERWVVLLGPIGTLVPVPGTSPSFRAFYLLLVPGIVLALLGGVRPETFRRLIYALPAVLYVVCSALLTTLLVSSPEATAEGGSPAARAFLFVALLFFFLCAVDKFAGKTFDLKAQLIGLFLSGYAVSLVAGYVLFVGYSAGLLDGETVERFQILFQTSFAGLMRFSPGSYPNEYGVVSSFALSAVVVLLTQRCRLADFFPRCLQSRELRPALLGFGLLTLGALFLSTTRAAYVSFLLSLAYLSFAGRDLKRSLKFLAWLGLVGLAIIGIAQQFYDVVSIFVGGYDAFFEESSSASERYVAWASAYDEFGASPWLGTGFATQDMIHNVYLQLFFGLGLVGTVVWLYSTLRVYASFRTRTLERSLGCGASNCREQDAFVKIKTIGIIHVAWFALGNHNLNHFLTWFVFLLVGIAPAARSLPRRKRVNLSTPPISVPVPVSASAPGPGASGTVPV